MSELRRRSFPRCYAAISGVDWWLAVLAKGRYVPQRIELLIVGAGPTGLALACLCRQLGVDLRIIDKNPGPSTTSKAIGLQYRVSEVLACMGIVDRFLERGGSPTPVNIYERGRRLVRLRFDLAGRQSGRDAFTPQPIMISQSETEGLLGSLLRERGGNIEWKTEFVDFRQEGGAVVSRVRRDDGCEEDITSAWLVSCEGAHSVIRKQAGIPFQGKTYPQAFVLADIETDWPLDHDENHVWVHESGTFAALPFPKPGAWRLMFDVSNDENESSGDVTPERIRRLLAERSGHDKVPIRNLIWLSEFRINCRMVDRFRQGRVFLAGDAAHIHSPTGGQGITTCIQDATNLAWKLGRVLRGAPESLLDTYHEERRPRAEEVLNETDRTTTVFFSTNLWVRLLRDHVVLPMLRMKTVQRLMFHKLAQLHVSYRGSSLSRSEVTGWTAQPRLKSGDRTPDIAFRFASSGGMITLFELLREVRPVVLLGPKSNPDSLDRLLNALEALDLRAYVVTATNDTSRYSHRRCLIDAHGDFSRFYGLEDDFLCLVRPDGHLGLVQRPIQVASLKEYLHQICPANAVERAFATLEP